MTTTQDDQHSELNSAHQQARRVGLSQIYQKQNVHMPLGSQQQDAGGDYESRIYTIDKDQTTAASLGSQVLAGERFRQDASLSHSQNAQPDAKQLSIARADQNPNENPKNSRAMLHSSEKIDDVEEKNGL